MTGWPLLGHLLILVGKLHYLLERLVYIKSRISRKQRVSNSLRIAWAEQIQTFRGPACRTTFSARRHTPLYRLKTPSHQIAMVLSALAEGLDPSAAERVFGYRQATITSLSDTRRETCTYPARALLLPSPPPAPAVGRTAHAAPLRHTGALALVGHRPLHQASSRPPARSAHAEHGTYGYPLLAAALSRLSVSPFSPAMG
jgi:hypothetical protein